MNKMTNLSKGMLLGIMLMLLLAFPAQAQAHILQDALGSEFVAWAGAGAGELDTTQQPVDLDISLTARSFVVHLGQFDAMDILSQSEARVFHVSDPDQPVEGLAPVITESEVQPAVGAYRVIVGIEATASASSSFDEATATAPRMNKEIRVFVIDDTTVLESGVVFYAHNVSLNYSLKSMLSAPMLLEMAAARAYYLETGNDISGSISVDENQLAEFVQSSSLDDFTLNLSVPATVPPVFFAANIFEFVQGESGLIDVASSVEAYAEAPRVERPLLISTLDDRETGAQQTPPGNNLPSDPPADPPPYGYTFPEDGDVTAVYPSRTVTARPNRTAANFAAGQDEASAQTAAASEEPTVTVVTATELEDGEAIPVQPAVTGAASPSDLEALDEGSSSWGLIAAILAIIIGLGVAGYFAYQQFYVKAGKSWLDGRHTKGQF